MTELNREHTRGVDDDVTRNRDKLRAKIGNIMRGLETGEKTTETNLTN